MEAAAPVGKRPPVVLSKPCTAEDARAFTKQRLWDAGVTAVVTTRASPGLQHVFHATPTDVFVLETATNPAELLFPSASDTAEEAALVQRLRQTVGGDVGQYSVPIAAVGISMLAYFEQWYKKGTTVEDVAAIIEKTFCTSERVVFALAAPIMGNQKALFYDVINKYVFAQILSSTSSCLTTPVGITTLEQMMDAVQPFVVRCDTFTNHHECCGMVGRGEELDVALDTLRKGFGEKIKEVKYPLGVVSAPRQGKSLFLDVLAEEAKRVLNNESLVTIKVTMNADTKLPHELKFAVEAAALLWEKIFGKKVPGLYDGRTARELLERLLPGKYIIIYVDELTILTDHLPKEEHESLAALLLSLYSERTMLVFSGFDFHIDHAFRSSSGRQPQSIFLPPIFTSDEDYFAQLLPLKNALLCLHEYWRRNFQNNRRLAEYEKLHLYYEVSKTSPGILGSLLEVAVRCHRDPKSKMYHRVPLLNPKMGVVPKVFALMGKYSGYCATTNSFPVVTSELGVELLENKIGVVMANEDHCGSGLPCVYVVPAIAFFLSKDHKEEALLWQWGRVIVGLLQHWIPRATTHGAGNILEQFVFACLSFKFVAKGWVLSPPGEDEDFKKGMWLRRYENKYPLEPLDPSRSAANSLAMTQGSLFGIDLVIRETRDDGVHETLVQIKGGRVEPKSVIKQLARPIGEIVSKREGDTTPCIVEMMNNMKAAGVTRVSYVLLGTLPSSASGEEMLDTLCASVGDNAIPLPLTVKAVRLGSREADLFLTPLFASAMPNIFAKDNANVENIYHPNVENTADLWCAVKGSATGAGVEALRQTCKDTAAAAVATFEDNFRK